MISINCAVLCFHCNFATLKWLQSDNNSKTMSLGACWCFMFNVFAWFFFNFFFFLLNAVKKPKQCVYLVNLPCSFCCQRMVSLVDLTICCTSHIAQCQSKYSSIHIMHTHLLTEWVSWITFYSNASFYHCIPIFFFFWMERFSVGLLNSKDVFSMQCDVDISL